MTGQLRKRARDEKRIRESGVTERSGWKTWRWDDSRSCWEQMQVSVESKRDSTKLKSEGESSNRAAQQEEVAASVGGRGWCKTGISD